MMFKNLKKDLKKKFETNTAIKILVSKDYNAFKSFLSRKSKRKIKDVIEHVGLAELSKYKIKQGDLLYNTEHLNVSCFDTFTNLNVFVTFPKNSMFLLLSFNVLQVNYKKIIPNAVFLYSVFYNEKIYYLNAEEFLWHIDANQIKCCDLSV